MVTDKRHLYRICRECDYFSNVLEGESYCIKCGGKLFDTCPGCAKPIGYPFAQFCAFCGTNYRAPVQPISTERR